MYVVVYACVCIHVGGTSELFLAEHIHTGMHSRAQVCESALCFMEINNFIPETKFVSWGMGEIILIFILKRADSQKFFKNVQFLILFSKREQRV